MTTYALQLSQIFVVAQRAPNEKLFVDAVAEQLGLEGDNAQIQAVATIHGLLQKINKQIEELPIDDESKSVAHSYFRPFTNLLNFAHFNLKISDAKNQFLKSDHLVGLTSIHMALSGHADIVIFPQKAKDLAEEFRSLKKQVAQLDLPEDALRALLERINQISILLENATTFGPEKLKREIEALFGALYVNSPKGAKGALVTLGLLYTAGLACLHLVQEVDQTMQSAISIEKNAPLFMDIIHHESEQQD